MRFLPIRALPVLGLAALALPSAAATGPALTGLPGSPGSGVQAFLRLSPATFHPVPSPAGPGLRATRPDSTRGYNDPECSTEEGTRATCSANQSKNRCSAVKPGRMCSAFNESPNTAGYQCSVLVALPGGAVCSAKSGGLCSGFGDQGGPVQCSVSPGTGGTCSSKGTGSCSASAPNTCSVIGQPSSTGPCQG